MIYRIWNTKEKRYATDEEMKYLRVNPDTGAVEKMENDSYYNKELGYCYKVNVDWDNSCEYIYWQPDPNAEVEWGVTLDGTTYFDNDIVTSFHGIANVPFNYPVNILGLLSINTKERDYPLKMLGVNAHDNPELLGNAHESTNDPA